MNNIKRIIFAMTLFIMLPLVAFADCQSDFNAIASEFKFSYKYDETTDDFTITITNPDYKRYSIYYGNKEDLNNAKRGFTNNRLVVTINNYKSDTYTYGFVATYDGCQGVTVKKETVSLKKYNSYADNPECEGNEDFVLCQKEYDKEIDEETFESRLEAYEKSKGKSNAGNTSNNDEKSNESTDTNKTVKQSIIEKATNYIKENTVEVIIASVFIIALIISVIVFLKTSNEGRRLE